MLDELKKVLRASTDTDRALHAGKFFKAGPGQYAEGDHFLGNSVPSIRAIAKSYKDLPLDVLHELLISRWHEERLLALIILVEQYNRHPEKRRDIFEFYLCHCGLDGASFVPTATHKKWASKNDFYGINNWDLVDTSAGYIVGQYLEDKPDKMTILRALAHSETVWERRVAIISTFAYIKQGRPDEGLEIAELLLSDRHDLIQKAVGWMLREIGKRCDRAILVDFLAKHYKVMPRTMLRYSIEHFDEPIRKSYLIGKI